MKYVDYIANPHRSCAIVAHRGVWRAAPENSLLAIERAILAGHDVVGIDVRRSADGEFFLMHDDTLERMAGLDRVPESLTLQELTGLHLRDRNGGKVNPKTAEKLPSLKEVFDLTRDRIFVHLEVKNKAMIPEVIPFAKSMRVDQQVDFGADLRTVQDLGWIDKTVVSHGVPFVAKTRLGEPDAEMQLELVLKLKPFICEITFTQLQQIAELKDLFYEVGIALWANTLDAVACAGFTDTQALKASEAIWGRLIDAGISVIQTDEVEALRSFLARHDGRKT